MDDQNNKFIPIPKRHLYLQRKSKLRKVFYTQIPDTVDQSHLLRGILPKQWNVSPPDAIIAITGISHQFNIKNKRNLKKDLIEAVKSTGSWIVTCGTECGVVKFIEDAVNDHVTLTEYNIPIVGLLSEGVLDEIEPLKRFIHGKEKKYGKSIIIPVSSTKESLDPNHTQFIFLGDLDMKHLRGTASSECRNAFQRFLSNIKDADFKTKIFNDKPKITEHDTYSKNGQCETNEILPVVLVLIEGGIDALETVLSVLKNNNHVVVIDGSGGAANFLSTCYQLVTSFKKKTNGEQATLSDSSENIRELVSQCFDDESLEEEAKTLVNNCLKKHKLIHIYSLEKKSTKVAEFIQNAIFNTYKDYYKNEVNKASGLKNKHEMNIKAVKKQLKLVEKWKRCDIATKEIFISKHRTQLTYLQTLDEKRMGKLPNEMKHVIDQVRKNYKKHSKDLTSSYTQFKKDIEEVNKEHIYNVLSTAYNTLFDHVERMPLEYIKRYKKELYEIQEECNDLRKLKQDEMNELQRLDEPKRMNKLQDSMNNKMNQFLDEYKYIINNLAHSYEKFKKSVLQFEEVNKKPYYSALKKSCFKLADCMLDEDCEKLKTKFTEIEEESDDMQTLNEKEMAELDTEIEKIMEKNKYSSKSVCDAYGRFKKDVKQFKEVNKENYFMDRNKAKYFTNVSTSLTELMKSMEGEFEEIKHDDIRKIIHELVDEYEKDSVSDLFQSTLIAKKTDFVILIMDKIEHMSAFVLGYLPNVFRLCIDSEEDSVIQLIDQHWEKFRNSRKDSEKKGSTELEKVTARLQKRKDQKNNRILLAVNNFIIDLFEDTEFKLYEVKEGEEIDLIYKDKPFHHLFVWAVLVNCREMAMIFWELETDHTCAALFASAVLNELAEKALFSKHMHHSATLKENAEHFETLACNLMTELYSTDRESALKTLVTKVGRFNSTPLKIAVSQKLRKFMAHTACQAQLNRIWSGDIAVYTPAWKIGMVIFLPILLIQSMGFIIIKPKKRTSKQISPGQNGAQKPSQNRDPKPGQNRYPGQSNQKDMLYSAYRFYCAPVTKFVVYMITYMAFVVIFATFVLTDLYPLSESPPSIFEYLTWVWTLSLAIEEIRQILQTNKGSLSKNLKFWAKDFWNIFDMVMYILFLLSVVLRCLLNSEDFYFARMSYAITLSMFVLRSMHFFFIQRYIGPKVVMIGRMLGDLGFFIALYALFLFSFGIMYQAILFPNSVSSPWEMLKNLVFLPYWQLYGELNLEQIEGAEPSKCTNDPQLYTNGTMDRCPESNQFNMLMPAVYLILTNILLVNIIIAIFSQTFQNVQNNSEMIYKFHMYALVYEYHDRPMFPIPIVIHVWRIIVFCYHKIWRPTKYGGAFVIDAKPEEIEKLHIREKTAYETLQNGPYYTRNKYDAMKMMTDERDILKEIDSTPTQQDIKDLRLEMQRMRESLIQEIRNLEYRQPVVVLNNQQ